MTEHAALGLARRNRALENMGKRQYTESNDHGVLTLLQQFRTPPRCLIRL